MGKEHTTIMLTTNPKRKALLKLSAEAEGFNSLSKYVLHCVECYELEQKQRNIKKRGK